MKHRLLLLLLLPFTAAMAQTDSVSMLPGSKLDIFYNLSTGHTDTVANNNWHIAVALRKAQPPLNTMQAASVRINDGINTELYRSEQFLADWRSFDTTGWMLWPRLLNNDSTWDIGAFNADHNPADGFNYGWGEYSMITKDVTGSNMYLLAMASSPMPGSPRTFKKVYIDRIVYDTMWVFSVANLDGSDSTTYRIRKSAFGNKLYAYVNLTTKEVLDREPDLSTWSILFTKYQTPVTMFGQTLMYPVTGVLLHPTARAARWASPVARTATPDASLMFRPVITSIGWDWKEITTTPGPWPVKDSLAYVVKTGTNQYHKIYFTEYFASSTSQYIRFNKTFYSQLTGLTSTPANSTQLSVFPNPASEMITVSLTLKNAGQVQAQVYNLNGQLVASQSLMMNAGVAQMPIMINGLPKGMYLLQVNTGSAVEYTRFLVD